MMVLREATLDDVKLLRYWDEQPHVRDASDDDWEWEEDLRLKPKWREQLIAEFEDRPIGFVQIIDPALEETHYWGEVEDNLRAIDIWIGEADDLRKGFGTQIIKLALDRCFKNEKVRAVIIDPLESNTNAHRFYEFIGFEFVRKQAFLGDKCLVYKLERHVWELKWSEL